MRCVSRRAPDSPSASAFMRSTSFSVTCSITVASSTFCSVFCLITFWSWIAVSMRSAASARAVASFTSFWYSCCFRFRSRCELASEAANEFACTAALRAFSASAICASDLALATVCRAEDRSRAALFGFALDGGGLRRAQSGDVPLLVVDVRHRATTRAQSPCSASRGRPAP